MTAAARIAPQAHELAEQDATVEGRFAWAGSTRHYLGTQHVRISNRTGGCQLCRY